MPLITPVIRSNLVADKAKTPRVCWTRAAGQTTAAKTTGHYRPHHLMWYISNSFLCWRCGWNTLTNSNIHTRAKTQIPIGLSEGWPRSPSRQHTRWRGLALPTWVKVSFQRGPTPVYLRAGSALQPCVRLLTTRILYNTEHTRHGFVTSDWMNALYRWQHWLFSRLILVERQSLALKSTFHMGRAVNPPRS